MNLKSLLSICMAILLILAFLTPGVMAKENQKYYSNDFFISEIDDSKAVPISKNDWAEIEELINMFLKEDGIVIENLDLSNLKKIETEDSFILVGKLKYDIQSIDSKSIVKSASMFSKSQEMSIASKFDKVDNSFRVESSSKANQNYVFDLRKDLNDEYILKESFFDNGKLNVVANQVLIPVEESSISLSNIPLTPGSWHGPANNPPPGSTWAYNGKLSSLIAAGSIAVGAVVALISAATLGTGTSIALGIVVGVATWFTSNALPRGVSADFVYLDYYHTVYPRPFYNAHPAIGYAHPTVPIYAEIERYYVVPM